MLLTTPVIWGLTFPAAKLALEHTNPWTFTAWSRVLGLAALCAVLLAVRPPRETWQRGLIPAGALLGCLMFAAFALQSLGLQYTTATNAGFITVLYVVFAPLGAAALARRAPPRVAAICLPMALVGLGLLSLNGLGLKGWQWMFITEAVPALALGLYILARLCDRPRQARWLSDMEKAWLEGEVQSDRPHGTMAEQVRALFDRRVTMLSAANWACGAPKPRKAPQGTLFVYTT